MFGFNIKVKYVAKVKVYTVRYWAMQEESVIKFEDKVYNSAIMECNDGRYRRKDVSESQIKQWIRKHVESGAVWYDDVACISGVFKAKIIDVSEGIIYQDTEFWKLLPKWKKYIDEPYIIELK